MEERRALTESGGRLTRPLEAAPPGLNLRLEVIYLSDTLLLELQNIGKEYYGNRVLSNVSFSLRAGEILGLVGENGAGKSTLMNILFGMPVIAQTGGYEGTVLMDGSPVHFTSPREALEAGIGMVHQEFSLIPGFTATENILLNREVLNPSLLEYVFSSRMATLDRLSLIHI